MPKMTILITELWGLIALSGLILAAWGLMVTPEEIREGQELNALLNIEPIDHANP